MWELEIEKLMHLTKQVFFGEGLNSTSDTQADKMSVVKVSCKIETSP